MFGGLSLLLLLVIPLAASFGASEIPPSEVVKTLLSPLFPRHFSADPPQSLILFKIRLPRILLAGFGGGGLALAGAVFQGIFRNPLAEPYLLGVSSGAALGATLAIILGGGMAAGGLGVINIAAFAGALGSALLIFLLAGRRQFRSLLLGGIALGYIFQAFISLMMMLNYQRLEKIVFWMMGSLTSATWPKVGMTASLVLLPGLFLFIQAKSLNILSLGQNAAHSLGVNFRRTGGILLLTSCLITASVVSAAGLIGFIGLMVPHILRIFTGPDHRRLLPASALGGAFLLILADLGARTLLSPKEIPVGVITAILGGPFFLVLLGRQNREAPQ